METKMTMREKVHAENLRRDWPNAAAELDSLRAENERLRYVLDLVHSRILTFDTMSQDFEKHGNIPPQHDILAKIEAALSSRVTGK